jgi:undecaprenyl-diphosphatase
MAATLLYGLLAAFAILVWKGWRWRTLVIFGALLTIALVGFSRIVLGAHYLSDVLGAIASGIGWLLLCVTLVERARRRRLATETKAELGAFVRPGSRPFE